MNLTDLPSLLTAMILPSKSFGWKKCDRIPCVELYESSKDDSSNISGDKAGIKIWTCLATWVTVIGLIGNLSTLLVLKRNKEMIPKISRLLLMHQTFLDTMVCSMGIGIYTQPYMWMTGNILFDLLLCQAWHGQALYWTVVLLSGWNVVLIAFDRFIVINHPLKHRVISNIDIGKIYVLLYLSGLIFLLPAYFVVTFETKSEGSNACLDKPYIKYNGFWEFYGIFWFIILYAIPVALLLVLYAKIKIRLNESRRCVYQFGDKSSIESDIYAIRIRNFETADRQMTKTAIAIAVVFAISLGWDAFYCMLGFNKIINYEFNTPLQVTGVFLATLDSCSTPFIYVAAMPDFRKKFLDIFDKRHLKRTLNQGVDQNQCSEDPTIFR